MARTARGFARQQFGTMHGGAQTLHYEVVPGSGSGQLAGITGTLHLDVEQDGTHRYDPRYDLWTDPARRPPQPRHGDR